MAKQVAKRRQLRKWVADSETVEARGMKTPLVKRLVRWVADDKNYWIAKQMVTRWTAG